MAYLTVRIKGVEGYTRNALDKDRLVLGRSSTSDIPIKHSSISREHCAVVKVEGGWQVEDLGSANGTHLNKVKITANTVLKERDVIAIGAARLTFHAGNLNEPEVAIDINLDEGGEAGGPTRKRGEHDPAEATECTACGTWLSIAHRLAGDQMECPRCKADVAVPSLVS